MSAVAFGPAQTAERETGSAIVATSKATTRIGRNGFMHPPRKTRLFYSQERATTEDAGHTEKSWTGSLSLCPLWLRFEGLCYTSGHLYETHFCVASHLPCAWNRHLAVGFGTDLEPARHGHAAGKASAQCAPVDVRRPECRGLFLRRRQKADLPVVAWRRQMRPDFRDEYRRH